MKNGSIWSFTYFQGKDARDLLHRISTLNVRSLEPGTGSLGFILNPQAKIEAYFYLWCLEEGLFAFEIESRGEQDGLQALKKVVDRYTFAEDAVFGETLTREMPAGHAPGRLLDPRESNEKLWSVKRSGESWLCTHDSREFGKLWVTTWGQAVGESIPNGDILRIQQTFPIVGAELTLERSQPLELGLQFGIHDQKGCYPGQEVIEKIVALGSPARKLAGFRIEGSLASGKSLEEFHPKSLTFPHGEVTSAHYDGRAWDALALLRKTGWSETANFSIPEEPGLRIFKRGVPHA
jgi:folate-binding protein YgfZ